MPLYNQFTNLGLFRFIFIFVKDFYALQNCIFIKKYSKNRNIVKYLYNLNHCFLFE